MKTNMMPRTIEALENGYVIRQRHNGFTTSVRLVADDPTFYEQAIGTDVHGLTFRSLSKRGLKCVRQIVNGIDTDPDMIPTIAHSTKIDRFYKLYVKPIEDMDDDEFEKYLKKNRMTGMAAVNVSMKRRARLNARKVLRA